MLEDFSNTLKDMSNNFEPILPMTSLACYAVGVFLGRKFCLAASCKIASIVSTILGKQNLAEKFNKVGFNYWTLAKKDAFRDLTGAIGFIAGGYLISYADLLSTKENNEKNKEDKVIEPVFLEDYPTLNFLWNHPKSTLTAAGLSILGTAWTFRRILCYNYRIELIKQRNLLTEMLTQINPKNPFDMMNLPKLKSQRESYNYWINFIKPEKIKNEYHLTTDWIESI